MELILFAIYFLAINLCFLRLCRWDDSHDERYDLTFCRDTRVQTGYFMDDYELEELKMKLKKRNKF